MPFARRCFTSVALVVSGALVLVGAAACSSGPPAEETRPAEPATAARAEPATAARVVPAAPAEPVEGDPESVVVAAMILATGGDLDAALADGVVTTGDVELARSGLADGSLDGLFD